MFSCLRDMTHNLMNLEQLIEACGDNLRHMTRVGDDVDLSWYVVDTRASVYYGSTPTEAVEKLYNYLNKEKTTSSNQ